ncbi:MAG TPA: cellulase family glycosylhydrolase, partial [Roseiflexaceae bacterium]|nr:cellulase family glycosylhydrolase [Roseiflexaceae bacterium]
MSPPFYRRLRVLLPAAALLSLALAAFAWFDNEVNRGVTYAPEHPPARWADMPRLGVNAFNLQYEPDPAAVTRTLELARGLGARFVRIQMPWDDVEIHAKGDFVDRRNQPHRSAWEKYDFIVAEAGRLGLELIVRIDRAPQWARPNDFADPRFQAGLRENPDSTGPPERYADYADFVGTVAARYRGRVRFIQIWNEPNLSYEWSWRLPEPERFAELLRLAADAARAANPEVVILFPSLSPTDGLEPRKAPMSELEYLDRVYRAGAADSFDIMSAQAYGLGQPPDEHRYVRLRPLWHRPIDTRIDVSRVVMLREVMLRHGDAETAVWISEFGYNSAPPSVPEPARSTWGAPVSEEQKGEYLVGQLERARREWPWIGVMNVWFLRWGGYREADPADPTPHFALVGRDFTPLPAYERLRAYMAAPPSAGPGAHSTRHPAVRQVAEDTWELRFCGEWLALDDIRQPLSVAV